MALLIALQFAITWCSVRSPWFERLVKSEPTLVLHGGRFLDDAMRRQRVTRDEVLSVLRAHGESDVRTVHAVVLETDGSMSVLTQAPERAALPTLQTTQGAPDHESPVGGFPAPRSQRIRH